MSKKKRQPVEKSKAWERKRPFERRFETQEPNVTFLIVCEGEKTEPLYFEGFRVKSANMFPLSQRKMILRRLFTGWLKN